jgi:hypothetical protein
MADISKLEQQADLLMQNVSGWETNTLERIGKRIKKYGKLSLADVKSINNIATVKQDMDAITKELAKVTGYNISQIEQMYGELLEEQHLANQPLYDYRGKKFVPFKDNRELQAIAKAYARTTAGNMVNLSQIGGSNLGFIDKNGKFKAIEKMYAEALDKAVIQVSTGATDFHTAMRDTIVEMGGSGIRINYADSGITRRLDTAVRQSLLWGAKQASIEYNEMIGQELGCDGIEIDYHSNPRPSHEIMQGKQYSIVGKKTINGVTYEDAYEQGIDSKDHESGLLNDYGCLHYKTPIILGISEPRYSEKELARLKEQDKKTYEIDGKQVTGYEATQIQRRLETAVRNEKSIKNMAQAEGDKKLVSDCNAKIKAYQTKYNEISEITGIQGDKKRMSIPRGSTSVKGATPTPKKIDVMAEKKIAYDDAQKIVGKYGDKSSMMLFGNDEDLARYTELMQKAKGYEPPKPKIIDYKEQITKNVDSLSPSKITPKTITKAQEDAISSYSRTGYTDINNYLRFGNVPKQMPKSQMLQYVDDLNALLDANPLQEEIFVKRGINTRALEQMLGTETITDASAVGKVITDKGFMSTTPYKMGGFGGNTQLFIKCPKGTKGTYIADWCANPAEKEFLIAPNQKMIVRKIEKEMVWDEPHYKVFVDIITGG